MVMNMQTVPAGIEDGWGKQRELIGARKFIDIFLNVGNPDSDKTLGTQPPGNLLWPKPKLHRKPQATPPAK